ncbi:hypothetical protein JYU34_009575 [Plutella xylostella]|uniref:Protein kinase domain-containing protein n=1 Tax=Plutella xylostella TaxID=51655 RepID=A0ABQ7QL61_PLUXY|nr:hypothetical protein JYU34_009575 [Plutella xylostella]
MSKLLLTDSETDTLRSRGFRMLKKLNEGAFAKVYRSEYRKSPNHKKITLACKVMDVAVAPLDFVDKFLPREIEALTTLSHPHLVHTHSIFFRGTKYFIFMRFMEHGDLLDFILEKGVVTEDQARIWMRQLLLGLQYMHLLEVAHRDIKCENALLTSNKNVKLSDFGFARICVNYDFQEVLSETFCGSLAYTAPEILSGEPYFPKPTDLWSMGVVMYVMLNRALPFRNWTVEGLYEAQMENNWRWKQQHAKNVSRVGRDFLRAMMDPDPDTRWNVDRLVDSTWIKMDMRLRVWTPQEIAAYRKARAERNRIRGVLHMEETDTSPFSDSKMHESTYTESDINSPSTSGASQMTRPDLYMTSDETAEQTLDKSTETQNHVPR